MSRKLVRLKESGHFDGESKVAADKMSLDKPVLMVYTGKFESMDGPVEIKDEDIETLAANHNGFMSKLGRLASGEVHPRHNPPLQLDHSTSARDTVGRLVGNLSVGEHVLEDGSKVKALMGTARVLGKENVEKVEDGRWTHLSGGFDLENHKVSELTITPFPAAAEAHMLSKARLHKDILYMEHDIRVYPAEKDGTSKWRWETRWSSGVADSEASAVADAKKSIDEFHKFNPELRAWMMDISRMAKKDVSLPGHLDEALWQKARRAYDEAVKGGSKIDDQWAFIMDWYKKNGGRLSQGEEHMGYKDLKEKAALYEKARKHLTEHKKMSEEDAEKHLEAAKPEELTAMGKEHDEHLKHMAEDEEKKREEEKKLAARLAAHKPALIKLAKGFKESAGKAQLAEKSSKISFRLSQLRAQAKITPAEIKTIKIDELAAKADDVINAALSSYDKRLPVIDTGLIGSTKAMSPAQLASSLKKMGMERKELETRLNMPSKREEALKRLKEIEEQEKKMGDHEHHALHADDGDDDKHFESAYMHHKKLSDEGKHDEAKEHLRSYMKSLHSKHMGDAGSISDPTPAMSALAAEVKNMQNEFTEFVKLTAPAFGATLEELT